MSYLIKLLSVANCSTCTLLAVQSRALTSCKPADSWLDACC